MVCGLILVIGMVTYNPMLWLLSSSYRFPFVEISLQFLHKHMSAQKKISMSLDNVGRLVSRPSLNNFLSERHVKIQQTTWRSDFGVALLFWSHFCTAWSWYLLVQCWLMIWQGMTELNMQWNLAHLQLRWLQPMYTMTSTWLTILIHGSVFPNSVHFWFAVRFYAACHWFNFKLITMTCHFLHDGFAHVLPVTYIWIMGSQLCEKSRCRGYTLRKTLHRSFP